MAKFILIHANCRNDTARGDYVFAANIAKDLIHEIQASSNPDIQVCLVSTLDGAERFAKIYGPVNEGKVTVDGMEVHLSSLEEFDAVANYVVAFIDANRCKYSPAEIVKRVMSPDSKFLFVGNANQTALPAISTQLAYIRERKMEQLGLYNYFDTEDIFAGAAGIGADRLGLPTINPTRYLPSLTTAQQSFIPKDKYNFMYVRVTDYTEYKLVAQYIKLANFDHYILVGDFEHPQQKKQIETEYHSLTKAPFPTIHYYQSLPNIVMRHMVANATGTIVLSTGTTSTLEAMLDDKLPFYQTSEDNVDFVSSYLLAVKSIVANDSSLIGCMPQLIIELSSLLFADKPLSLVQAQRTEKLLQISSVNSHLLQVNRNIVEQANGKIATRLLGFINGPKKTNDQFQLAEVCASLRKPSETGSPVYDQALRRAASWGKLFEIKVLIKSIPGDNLNKQDPSFGRTALHWAVHYGHLDCARALVEACVDLNCLDNDNKSPLHLAIARGDKAMIQMLKEAGAALIVDHDVLTPKVQDIQYCMSQAQYH